MGEYAEMAIFDAFGVDISETGMPSTFKPKRRGGQVPNPNDYWTTINGEILLIANMESSHIRNCLHMLQRKTSTELAEQSLSAIAYAASAPDGAAMCAENESISLDEYAADPEKCWEIRQRESPVFRNLLKELKKRKYPFNATVWKETNAN